MQSGATLPVVVRQYRDDDVSKVVGVFIANHGGFQPGCNYLLARRTNGVLIAVTAAITTANQHGATPIDFYFNSTKRYPSVHEAVFDNLEKLLEPRHQNFFKDFKKYHQESANALKPLYDHLRVLLGEEKLENETAVFEMVIQRLNELKEGALTAANLDGIVTQSVVHAADNKMQAEQLQKINQALKILISKKDCFATLREAPKPIEVTELKSRVQAQLADSEAKLDDKDLEQLVLLIEKHEYIPEALAWTLENSYEKQAREKAARAALEEQASRCLMRFSSLGQDQLDLLSLNLAAVWEARFKFKNAVGYAIHVGRYDPEDGQIRIFIELLEKSAFNETEIRKIIAEGREEVKAEQRQKKTELLLEIFPYLRASASKKIRILFPYNLDQYHWVLGEIHITKNKAAYIVDVYAHDGYGTIKKTGDEHFDSLKKVIEGKLRELQLETPEEKGEVFSCFTTNKETPYAGKRQHDGVSCGVIMSDELCLRIEDKPLNGNYPSDTIELRKKHLQMMKQRPRDPDALQFILRNSSSLDLMTDLKTAITERTRVLGKNDPLVVAGESVVKSAELIAKRLSGENDYERLLLSGLITKIAGQIRKPQLGKNAELLDLADQIPTSRAWAALGAAVLCFVGVVALVLGFAGSAIIQGLDLGASATLGCKIAGICFTAAGILWGAHQYRQSGALARSIESVVGAVKQVCPEPAKPAPATVATLKL